MNLAGKKIVLGLTGGIACYKAAEFARALVKAGVSVQVVMTEAAPAFHYTGNNAGPVGAYGVHRSVGQPHRQQHGAH